MVHLHKFAPGDPVFDTFTGAPGKAIGRPFVGTIGDTRIAIQFDDYVETIPVKEAAPRRLP